MAFSTQKEFFHVPFMNEGVEYECKKACVKLKSYDSAIDDRSWAHDEVKQSKFLSDLVACQLAGGSGDNDDVGPAHIATGASCAGGKGIASKGDECGVLSGGDSLLECANIHLADYQKVMNIKVSLEKQLEVSNERLKTAKEENKKIKEILASKLDSNTAKDFYNKLQKLIAAGKLTKNEENEMLQIYQKMENLYKAYEMLQAENYYLKRLIEKMAARVSLDNIKSEPETSTDVGFLQKEVNTLRKECTMLRKMEDDYQKIKQQSKKPAISEQDAENIRAIIKERNTLRDKCQSLKHLERKVHDLENKASEAQKVAGQLSSNLNNQTNYINKVESDMQSMQKFYEDENQTACFKEECLKAQIADLKDELMSAKCQAQKAEMLSMEIGCLRNEVLKRDLALNDYDCQYKQLMDVVNELQAIKLQCLQDNQTQTCKNEIDELAFFTKATIEEIMKELKKRGGPNNELMDVHELGLKPNDTGGNDNEECCRELHRLQKELEDMKKKYDDALKRVKDLESANVKLLHDLDNAAKANAELTKKLKEGEEKMANMLKRIEQLDSDIHKNEQDTGKIGQDLEGTLGLVNQISDVQLKNQQLANAVSAINSRDDQKIIDDLRRQLEEELAKLKKCQQDNDNLIKEAKERENDLQKLKDLNNKLEADKKKLEDDKKKLEDDKKKLEDDKKKPEAEKKAPEAEKKAPEVDKTKPKNLEDDNKNLKTTKNAPESIEKSKKGNDEVKKEDKPIKDNENKPIINDVKDNTQEKDTKKGEAADSGKDFAEDKDKPAGLDKDKSAGVEKDKGATLDKDKPKTPLGKDQGKGDLGKDKAKTGLDKDKAAALEEFVTKKSDSFKSNLNKGRCFEKELRNLLDEFIQECRFCFCRLGNNKSKFYGICHKLYHCGINTLSFLELGYMHKKIFALAEQKKPGCLLNMILEEYKQHARSLLVRDDCASGGRQIEFKLSETNITETDQKCCYCKNELCCNNSEEMLKDKVFKLEKDIEIARKYLYTLKKTSLDTGLQSDCDDDASDTYNDRACSPQVAQRKASSSQHLKKIKARIMKYSDMI